MVDGRHPIFLNAIGAIQVGVEDFICGEPHRLASAVRSLTAGLLLLCKEKLRRISPDDEILVWKNIRPVPRGGEGVKFQNVGKATG